MDQKQGQALLFQDNKICEEEYLELNKGLKKQFDGE